MPKSTRFGAHRSSDSTELPNLMSSFGNFRSPSFTNGTLSKFLPGTAKPCTSSPPSEDCWLCKEVNRWNSALASLSLELTEEEPGRLCLRTSRDADRYPDFFAPFIPCDTVFLLACLARQHACIKRLSVYGGVFGCQQVPTSELLKLRPGSAVECIEISGCAARSWTALLNTVGDVCSLRILRIEDFVVNADSTSRLVELIQANKGCLRELSFSAHDAPSEIPVELISALYRCEALTELSLYGQPTLEATTALEQLMQSNESIQKLSLQDDTQDQRILNALCNGLSANLSPTELHYECASLNFGQLLQLLKRYSRLESLVLSSNGNRPMRLEKHHGMSLNTLLVHSAGLRSLEVRHCAWTSLAAEEVAAGLARNSCLERFDVSRCDLDFGIVLTLCSALETNDTLKMLVFSPDDDFLHEPVGLSEKLVSAKCFARTTTTWPKAYTPALTEALKVPMLCPEELHLSAFGSYNGSFQLCKALGNSTIKCLFVKFSKCRISQVRTLRGALAASQVQTLHEALAANSSIRKLVLQEDSTSIGCCFTVAEALKKNRTVTEISLSIHELNYYGVESLESVALASDALEKLTLNCIYVVQRCVYVMRDLCPSLTSAGTLKGFSIFNERCCTEHLVAKLKHCVDQNRRKWNCALHFVLNPCVSKRWAVAFESLQEKPCFLQRVTRALGKSSQDASRMIRLAKHFIARNYLLVTGVVSQGVACHPHLETQVDSLNSDCWLTIGEYLRVLDVVDDSSESWC
ncbi:uncharacterized protein LOC119405730 [Rhipicephalus sanguineus]|uniref:uncharacterized protein LOC119405730 n=1 Tax=Rhipicephalus sanguineus TaxID=34632 RepID=UPI0018958958|nr:uncharacterized protein LOC119405730 [Rhipicephalus sanguineus]